MNTQTILTQKEAVYQAVKAILKDKFKDGVQVALTTEQKASIIDNLAKDFIQKKIELKKSPANQEKLKSQELLKSYVKGLLNNWLKRDPRLNGTKPIPLPPLSIKDIKTPLK